MQSQILKNHPLYIVGTLNSYVVFLAYAVSIIQELGYCSKNILLGVLHEEMWRCAVIVSCLTYIRSGCSCMGQSQIVCYERRVPQGGETRLGSGKCLKPFLFALVVLLLSSFLLHHTWTHEYAQFHMCEHRNTRVLKGGGEETGGWGGIEKQLKKILPKMKGIKVGKWDRVKKMCCCLKITIKYRFLKPPQSYITHDYRNYPSARPLTLVCLVQPVLAICMGVCRVRGGGGEKRGKKENWEPREGKWEAREEDIYVRWRKQSETERRTGCGRSEVRGCGRQRREEKKVRN